MPSPCQTPSTALLPFPNHPQPTHKHELNFVETREASYKVTQNVPAGEYYWVVYAYDEFGDGIGFMDGFDLFVTNP